MWVVLMKNSFLSLYLASMNTHYGWSVFKERYLKKKERLWEPLLLTLALGPVFIMGIVLIWTLTESFYIFGLGVNQPQLPLIYGTLMVSVLALFFGFLSILSTFYFSQDLSLLIPLPLRSWEILAAKFSVVLTGQYVLNAVILLPLWLRYALLAKMSFSYFIVALLTFLVLPILPLALVSVVTILLMRLVNLSRYKDKLTLIGGIILLIVVFGGQYLLQQSFGSGDPQALLEQVLIELDGLIYLVGKVFPPSIWAAQAMAYSSQAQGWLNLFKLVTVSTLTLAILYFLADRFFLQSIVSGLEGSKGRERKHFEQLSQKPQQPLLRLAQLESKLFLRDPGFALNGLVGYVLLPFFAVLPFFGKKLEGNPFELLQLNDLPPLLIMGGIALFFAVMTAMSMISSTTFSREGKYLWIIKSLPLSIGQIITARVLAAQMINVIGSLLGVLPLAFLFKWNAWMVFWGILFGIILGANFSYFLILFDLRRPMLDWINPIKAVKSNLNAMLGLFGSFAVALLLFGLFILNLKSNTLWLIPIELGLVCALAFAFVRFLLKNWAEELWARI